MSNRIFVVDTSYLLELFKVGGDWEEKAHQIIKQKLDDEQQAGSQFYFPIPVLFELANHIADASNRQQVIKNFMALIENCLDDDIPYFITPCSNADSIKEFIQDLCLIINRFSDEFVAQKLGLTDVSIISEAERLKEKYKLSCKVHIWTRHNKSREKDVKKSQSLKAREPDHEPNHFV